MLFLHDMRLLCDRSLDTGEAGTFPTSRVCCPEPTPTRLVGCDLRLSPMRSSMRLPTYIFQRCMRRQNFTCTTDYSAYALHGRQTTSVSADAPAQIVHKMTHPTSREDLTYTYIHAQIARITLPPSRAHSELPHAATLGVALRHCFADTASSSPAYISMSSSSAALFAATATPFPRPDARVGALSAPPFFVVRRFFGLNSAWT